MDKHIISLEEAMDNKYHEFSLEEKKKLNNLIKDPQLNQQLRHKVENLIFIKKPPTPDEFLDPRNGWLQRSTVDDLYSTVRDDFLEIIENSHKYNVISLYGATRTGKSVLTRLIILYTQVFMHYLRDPQLYLGVSPDTNLSQYLICFNYNKTKQHLLEPLSKLMNKSERFERVKMIDQVSVKQAELGVDYFVYSNAAKTGEMTNRSGFQVQLGNDSPLSFIGADVLQAYVTEIGFFIEKAGATEEEIYRLYSDSVERIKATMGINKPFAFVLLDSSANRADSMIEKHILNDLRDQEDVFFTSRARWEVPEIAERTYPTWVKTKKTFPVCTGNGTYPAKIIDDKTELKDIPKNLLIHVPIDAKSDFKRNPLKSIKDIAGRPSSVENKLIQDPTIINNMFDENLPSIEGIIIADSMDEPKHLIWNRIHPLFFSESGPNRKMIKRANMEPRFIHFDPAFSSKGDVFGIACVHKERDYEKDSTVFVVDFAFPIGPGQNEINITAAEELIYDLVNIGHVNVKSITSDTFSNKQFEQNLKRMGINAGTDSMDRTLGPYLTLMNLLYTERIKAGKNIFLKNNLDSLIQTALKSGREKIDHTSGTTNNIYNGSWVMSDCGVNAKDVSDALAGAVWACYNNECLPFTNYAEEALKSLPLEERDDNYQGAGYNMLHKFY